MTQRLDRPVLAIAYVSAAMLGGAIQDAVVKWLLTEHGLLPLILVRSAVVVFILGILLYSRNGWSAFKTARKSAHGLRALYNLLAVVPFFYGLTLLSLADLTALCFTAPLFVVLLSGPMLGEVVGWRRIFTVGLGFIGALLIAAPGGETLNTLGVACALIAALAYALLMLQSRSLSRTESSELIVFYSAAGMTLGSGIALIWFWEPMDSSLLSSGALVGVISVAFHYLLVQAYRYAPAYIVAPYEYSIMLWALLFGFYFWDEMPNAQMLLGTGIIIVCGLYIIYREYQLNLIRSSQAGYSQLRNLD